MEIKVISQDEYKVSNWSGGTTTELFLYPADGDYAARNFQVRISSATVDLEESVFTSLPGVKRKLMVLDGEMRVVHKDHGEMMMGQYDVDAFLGDWDTTSYGKVRDFNLMLKDGAEGSMFYREVNEKATYFWQSQEGNQKILLYVIEGEGTFNDQRAIVGQMVILDQYQGETYTIVNKGQDSLKLAICQICL